MRHLSALAFAALLGFAAASAQMTPAPNEPPVQPVAPVPPPPPPPPSPPIPDEPPVQPVAPVPPPAPLPPEPPAPMEPPVQPVAPVPPLPPPAPTPPPPAPQAAGPASIDTLLASLPNVVTHYDSKDEQNGNVILTGLTISPKKPDGTADDSVKLTIGRVELDGFDADAVQRVSDAARYTGTPDETFRTLAAHIAINDLTLSVHGKAIVTMSSATEDAVQMKQLPFVPGGPNFIGQFKSRQLAILQMFGAIYDSLKSGPSTIDKMHFELDNATILGMYPPGMLPPLAAQTGGAVYDFETIRGESFDRGRVGRISYKLSAKTSSPQIEIDQTIDNASIDGIDVSKVLPFMIKAEWPPITRDALISIGGSCMDGLHMKITGIGTIDVPHACNDPVPFVWLIPEHFKVEANGTFTPAPPGEFKAPAYIAKYFTAPMDVGVAVEFAYDPDAGTAKIAHYGFHAAGFGSVDFAGTAGGLKLDALATLPSAYQQLLTLNGGALTLVDDGGVQKILEMSAASSSATSGVAVQPDALKLQAKSGIDIMVGVLGATPEAVAFGKAMKDFIDGGGKLVVHANPPTPLHYADMIALSAKGPSAIMAGYGLGAERTPP